VNFKTIYTRKDVATYGLISFVLNSEGYRHYRAQVCWREPYWDFGSGH